MWYVCFIPNVGEIFICDHHRLRGSHIPSSGISSSSKLSSTGKVVRAWCCSSTANSVHQRKPSRRHRPLTPPQGQRHLCGGGQNTSTRASPGTQSGTRRSRQAPTITRRTRTPWTRGSSCRRCTNLSLKTRCQPAHPWCPGTLNLRSVYGERVLTRVVYHTMTQCSVLLGFFLLFTQIKTMLRILFCTAV